MRNLIIIGAILFLILSCKKEFNEIKTNERFTDTVYLYLNSGFVIKSELFRFNESVFNDFSKIIDTSNIRLNIKYLTKIFYIDLDSTDNFTEPPSVPVTVFIQEVNYDSLLIEFAYCKRGYFDKFDIKFKDSLTLNKISVKYPCNAILDSEIRIGDNYKEIFDDYIPEEVLDSSLIMSQYRNIQKGVVFSIGLDDKNLNNYLKIISIELSK